VALAGLAFLMLWAGRSVPTLLLVKDVWSLDRIDPAERGVAVEERDVGLEAAADLYLPPGGARPRGALLLIHGLLRDGKRDPRLRGLATAVAAHGVAVLVPEFPDMKGLKVRREEVAEVARAVRALDSLPGVRRVGMAAFSFGAGPALLALAEPGVAERLDVLVLFGAYHDLTEVVAYQTTGAPAAPAGAQDAGLARGGAGPGAQDIPSPDPRARWYFLAANTDLVQAAHDRELLAEIARRRLTAPGAGAGGLEDGLGPEGRRFYDLLVNRDPQQFPALVAALGPAVTALLDELSPSHATLPELHADVFLIHARSDPLIPYPQSLALARQIRTTGRLRLAPLASFGHVGPRAPVTGWMQTIRQAGVDLLTMWATCRATLALQD
jgi:pimeloyl-ACP methyl ester carboxylesterase